ncbi:amidase [Actinomadura montaniterrae]|uniref:Amidase n=1 Tax=Actinomadura montaniterrae TaxID=1803903 RepID=A0A6L3WB95_9ACTN|nr:amidase family protein [Actinomadura montaniterrae]KAB2390339.1 amidase [Actinomadura montaniterrae]
MSDDFLDLDGVAQAGLVRTGRLSPAELVAAAIDRIERLDPVLGALAAERFERARDEAARPARPARGAFAGVPFLLKDAVQHSAGDRYQHGMTYLREHPWFSPADTALTGRYRAAGLVLLGRTKVPELTMSPTTEPLAHGPARNPWDTTRSSGGSSGGSAVAVASGMVAFAHGNDMGGSIRIPASCCGLVGLKPSRARMTLAPYASYWGPLTHEHVLTRTVRDSAAVLDATAGPTPGDLTAAPPPSRPWTAELDADPGRLHIGLLQERPSGGPVVPECVTAVNATARMLESLGHHVRVLAPGAFADAGGVSAMGLVIATSVARDVTAWERRIGVPMHDLEPGTAAAVTRGSATTTAQLLDALDVLARWSRRIVRASSAVDIVLSPTLPGLPPPLGTLSGDRPLSETAPAWTAMAELAVLSNISGQPAISLPLHRTETGLPIGVQLTAPYAREDLLFRLSSQLERTAPWPQTPSHLARS